MPSHSSFHRLLSTALVVLLALAALALALAPATAPRADAADTDVVALPDPALKRAINTALGAGREPGRDVTVAEAQTVRTLNAGADPVSELTGLQAFTGLTSLTVTGRRDLTDASPLAGLRLTSLEIRGGALQGTLDSIAAISSLTSLTLGDDGIFDVALLIRLTALRTLRLEQNQIADISSLAQLTSVTGFDLSANRITDVTPVSRLTNPTYLYLSDNRIEDVTPLARYSSLKLGTTGGALKVDGNRISDLSTFLTFTSKPANTGQSVYAGAYQPGGIQVPLARADSRVLPIAAANANEGAYDQATKTLTLTNASATSIDISPSWTVLLSETPTDPTIAGIAGFGQTLKASAESVARPTCESAFQWQREGIDITGATDERYQVTAADVGSRLTVRVTCGSQEGVSAPTASVTGTTPGAPAIVPSQTALSGVLGDPTNPGITINVGQTDAAGNRVDPSKLTLTATSDAPGVLPVSGVTFSGSGGTRTVAFAPVGRGYTNMQFTVTGPNGQTSSALFGYGASVRTTPTSRVLMGQGDSSTALPAGDGYLFVADDERSEIGLYDPSLSRYAVWESESLLPGAEVDFESSARLGDTMFWFGSHGNKKDGDLHGSRQAVYETTVSGTGRDARLTRTGSYLGLRKDLVAWDRAHGDRLGLAAAAADGVKPDLANGFNLEGAEFSPDGSELYLGFRSPVVEKDGRQMALIVPVKNLPALTSGKAAVAQFGEPILLDLDGHDIREIRKNDAGQYLIVSGTPGMWTPQSSQTLFAWTGFAEDPAVPLTTEVTKDLEPMHTDNGGAWEGIGELPDDLTANSQVRLIMDQGYDVLHSDSPKAENKKNPILMRKARTDVFTLTGNLGRAATVSGSGAFPDQAANTVGAPQVVRITNTGSERVRVKRVHVAGDDEQASDFLISQNTCAYTDPGPGATCRIAVRFAPAKVSTTSKAQLVIESNLTGAPRIVELTGTSTALPKGEPGKDGKDGVDGKNGADGAQGAPGTIITKSAKATVSVKALSKRRVQVAVSAKPVDRRHLNQQVTVKVSGVKGTYLVKLTNGKGIVKLTGSKARKVKAGKKVRVTVSVPTLTTRVATSSTLVTDYTIPKASKQQKVKVRK
ncbi:hypothetical protein [Nocardioides sp. W7]|uniref:hypothetical protein n=1 Tax=Nocardioides sp. W7 TaxID=2931390 RepID=UPI001FD307F4|nr:hypothetical protein [Nocardioides sp. W7]